VYFQYVRLYYHRTYTN